MKPFWTKNYPQNLAPEIDLKKFSNILEMIDSAIARYHSQIAYNNMGSKLSYNEVQTLSLKLASFLQNKFQITKGDKVAIMMPNLLQYPLAVLAILRTGATVININPLYTPRELKHLLLDSGAKAVIILENFATTLQSVLSETPVKFVITTKVGDMMPFPKNILINFAVKYIKKMVPPFQLPTAIAWTQALLEGDEKKFSRPKIDREDVAFLQYTGGTTGVSKGAMLSHQNIVANTLQIQSWVTAFEEIKIGKVICPLPLYHIFALVADCFVLFSLGSESILITNPRDWKSFIKTIKNSEFSAIIGVNSLFKHLMLHPDFKNCDFSKLKFTLGGGTAVEKAVAEEWRKVTGCTLVEAYGLTEASPAICINPPNIAGFSGKIGIPLPSTEVAICDNDGKELEIGAEGELWVRGPQVFQGYWHDPKESKEVLTEDGWLKTGDIAKLDSEGYLQLMDRKKDIIIVSGFNVYPNEIEDVVTSNEKVLEACAIAVPDASTGEAVKLFVVKKQEDLTEAELIAYCRKNLVKYKVPKIIEWRQSLPKSPVGKILRKDLKFQKV